jgi:flavin reductase ActVB
VVVARAAATTLEHTGETMSTTLNPIPSTQTLDFVAAMTSLASGVVVVTSRVGGRPWGMTITAFTSVSADPPTVLVSVGAETATALSIAETNRFGVSVLSADQLAVARYGAAAGAPKFLEPFVGPGSASASPAIDGALAHLDCEVVQTLPAADHIVFFGRVRAATGGTDGDPLVYGRRAYATLSSSDSERDPR